MIAVAASLWKRHRDTVLLMACYSIPSVLFLIFYWPPQGPGVDTGHVIATFPALYACAWICARERRHTTIAAVLLLSAHLGFWRMVLDTRFVNWTLSLWQGGESRRRPDRWPKTFVSLRSFSIPGPRQW